jgi:hypothetical protein
MTTQPSSIAAEILRNLESFKARAASPQSGRKFDQSIKKLRAQVEVEAAAMAEASTPDVVHKP